MTRAQKIGRNFPYTQNVKKKSGFQTLPGIWTYVVFCVFNFGGGQIDHRIVLSRVYAFFVNDVSTVWIFMERVYPRQNENTSHSVAEMWSILVGRVAEFILLIIEQHVAPRFVAPNRSILKPILIFLFYLQSCQNIPRPQLIFSFHERISFFMRKSQKSMIFQFCRSITSNQKL